MNTPHGQSTFFYKKGEKYIGEFKEGKHSGKIIKEYKNGDRCKCEIKSNEFVSG
jgi:hypothetical protein